MIEKKLSTKMCAVFLETLILIKQLYCRSTPYLAFLQLPIALSHIITEQSNPNTKTFKKLFVKKLLLDKFVFHVTRHKTFALPFWQQLQLCANCSV